MGMLIDILLDALRRAPDSMRYRSLVEGPLMSDAHEQSWIASLEKPDPLHCSCIKTDERRCNNCQQRYCANCCGGWCRNCNAQLPVRRSRKNFNGRSRV
jgi:hypothetical protein